MLKLGSGVQLLLVLPNLTYIKHINSRVVAILHSPPICIDSIRAIDLFFIGHYYTFCKAQRWNYSYSWTSIRFRIKIRIRIDKTYNTFTLSLDHTITDKHTISLSIINSYPVSILLGNTIRRARVKWSLLSLWNLANLAVQLRGGRLVELRKIR